MNKLKSVGYKILVFVFSQWMSVESMMQLYSWSTLKKEDHRKDSESVPCVIHTGDEEM